MMSFTSKITLGAFMIFYALQSCLRLPSLYFFILTAVIGLLIIVCAILTKKKDKSERFQLKLSTAFLLIGGLLTLNALSLFQSSNKAQQETKSGEIAPSTFSSSPSPSPWLVMASGLSLLIIGGIASGNDQKQ